MHHLIYLSSAKGALSAQELQDLLVQSRHNNEQLGITGLLLYKDGNFLQAIEGEKEAVEALYAKIALDHRHHGLLVLFNEEIPERDFASWTMGFRDLSSRPFAGFDAILNSRDSTEALADYPPKIRAFMRAFL
jgi:hypothetical protein